MRADQANIIVTRGSIYDVPPRPSLAVMCEAAGRLNAALAADRYAAEQRRRCGGATGLEKRCHAAAPHIPIAIAAMEAANGRWLPTKALQAAILAKAGVRVDCGDIGKALIPYITTGKVVSADRRGTKHWRVGS